jgi:hypothetical protein
MDNQKQKVVVNVKTRKVQGELSLKPTTSVLKSAKLKIRKTYNKVEVDDQGFVAKEFEVVIGPNEKTISDNGMQVIVEYEKEIRLKAPINPSVIDKLIVPTETILSYQKLMANLVAEKQLDLSKVNDASDDSTLLLLEFWTKITEFLKTWFEIASDMTFGEDETPDFESANAIFDNFIKTYPEFTQQVLVFLARKERESKTT